MSHGITTRQALTDNLRTYMTTYGEEKECIYRFLELLRRPACYERTHLPGHITGSAFITNETRSKVVLVHHVKLNKWLQPGGHADGDENITGVATREAEEETGIRQPHLFMDTVFDLDIHTIPERAGFPEHLHFDVRFLFQVPDNTALQVSDESHDVRWVPLASLDELTSNASIRRMKQKLELIAN